MNQAVAPTSEVLPNSYPITSVGGHSQVSLDKKSSFVRLKGVFHLAKHYSLYSGPVRLV